MIQSLYSVYIQTRRMKFLLADLSWLFVLFVMSDLGALLSLPIQRTQFPGKVHMALDCTFLSYSHVGKRLHT